MKGKVTAGKATNEIVAYLNKQKLTKFKPFPRVAIGKQTFRGRTFIFLIAIAKLYHFKIDEEVGKLRMH